MPETILCPHCGQLHPVETVYCPKNGMPIYPIQPTEQQKESKPKNRNSSPIWVILAIIAVLVVICGIFTVIFVPRLPVLNNLMATSTIPQPVFAVTEPHILQPTQTPAQTEENQAVGTSTFEPTLTTIPSLTLFLSPGKPAKMLFIFRACRLECKPASAPTRHLPIGCALLHLWKVR